MADLWLTKPSNEPPALLADSLIRKLGLEPPIDIEALARESADISDQPWPFSECDAVVVGLLGERPSIFVRRGLPWRRRRFTLAHEYGHLKLGWHIGIIGCNPNNGQFDEPPIEPADDKKSIGSWWRLEEQEAEATRFASYFLMPENYLRPLIATTNMSQVLAGLDQCDVSAAAALMRLKSTLQPGVCFAMTNQDGSIRLFSSPGTSLSLIDAGSEISTLQNAAYESGEGIIGERRVHWFRLTDFTFEESVQDDRSTTNIARAAIAAVVPDPDQQRAIYLSINGIVGGSLSKDRAGDARQALAILRQRFRDDVNYSDIVAQPDFALYLRRKAEEWAAKRNL